MIALEDNMRDEVRKAYATANGTNKPVKVTKANFQAYEDVRKSGQFNMVMQARHAADAAGIDIEVHMAIVKQYDELSKKFCA